MNRFIFSLFFAGAFFSSTAFAYESRFENGREIISSIDVLAGEKVALSESFTRKNTILSAQVNLSQPADYIEIGRSSPENNPALSYGGCVIRVYPDSLVVYQYGLKNIEGKNTYLLLPMKTFPAKFNLLGSVKLSLTTPDFDAFPHHSITEIRIESGGAVYSTTIQKCFTGCPYFLCPVNCSIVELSFLTCDFNKPVWMYGDSYFSYAYPGRWTYWLAEWGLTNFRLSHRAGQSARQAYEGFLTDLRTGTPKIAVWCEGMNGADDKDGAPNAEWLEYTQKFIDLCRQKGIEPVLGVTPTVRHGGKIIRLHDAQAEWVRKSSGCRYIDFAATLTFPDGEWKPGRCQDHKTNVHTSVMGAHLQALDVVKAIPEISVRPQKPFLGAKKSSMSERIVRSEMTRCKTAMYLDFRNGVKTWDYASGLEMKSFLDVASKFGLKDIDKYVDAWYDAMISEDGTIAKYKKENYTLDHICPGRTLVNLYQTTGKEKYKKAMDVLRDQMDSHPATKAGGYWHKKIYPHQIWLDGLYMAEPFLVEYAAAFQSPEKQKEVYKESMNQFIVAAEKTYDRATGLYRHAWDESKSMFWCNPTTGQSDHCWARALGWYAMAIVEVMDTVPENTPGRSKVLKIFRGIVDALPKYADPQTGMWYQVMDRPGQEGNYLEATSSAMFTYALLKAVRKGYLPASYKDYAVKCWDCLLETFVRYDASGLVNLEKCCAVGGLGGGNKRRGDYAYYLSEPVYDNDPKGMGPLVWAALEVEAMR